MKNTLLIFTLLISSLTFANERIELLDSNIEIKLNGQSKTFEILRTLDTPPKVTVKVNFRKARSICVEYDSHEVWVDGETNRVCEPDGEVCSIRNGRRICEYERGECYDEYIPGHYETRSYCIDWDDVYSDTSKTVKLNFKKAKELKAGESEIFKVNIKQASRYRRKLEMTGETIESLATYNIQSKQYFLGYLNLRFDLKVTE